METIEELFLNYYSRLCLYATSILGDPANAEDAVQGIFYKLVNNKQENLETERITLPYLYTSVKNTCLNIIRKENAKSHYLETTAADIVENAYDEKLIKTEMTMILMDLLESLPEGCAKILKMSYIEGLKHKEIAAMLNLSINTVKSQKARGIALLKEKVPLHFLVSLLLFLKKI
ncbi:MAG: RNA polymerase sigma-70 factor [Sphingobacterium sp.]|jgi:RNA polymerase sigma-70 factor (ECF subfamily)|nr:RNA polymerase sigma-70 factor [Sphingobacterium sp.]